MNHSLGWSCGFVAVNEERFEDESKESSTLSSQFLSHFLYQFGLTLLARVGPRCPHWGCDGDQLGLAVDHSIPGQKLKTQRNPCPPKKIKKGFWRPQQQLVQNSQQMFFQESYVITSLVGSIIVTGDTGFIRPSLRDPYLTQPSIARWFRRQLSELGFSKWRLFFCAIWKDVFQHVWCRNYGLGLIFPKNILKRH